MSSFAEYHDRSGWCPPCAILWNWHGDPCGRDAYCPQCRAPMQRKPRQIKRRHVVRDIDTPELYALLRSAA